MITQLDRKLDKFDEFDLDIKLVPSMVQERRIPIQASGSCGGTCTCQSINSCAPTCDTGCNDCTTTG